MGSQPPRRQPGQRAPDVDDTIIQMRIQSKQVARQAKTSQKQSQKYMKKAKQNLKKNNQQGAKMYLTSAAQKKTEALNYQRTAVKMQVMCDRVKSMKNNQKLVGTFNSMTNAISQQMAQMDPAKNMQSMNLLNQKMDQMMINQKMMSQMMSQNQSMGQNNTINQMMNVLKQEIHMEETNNLNQDYVNPQQQKNVNSNNNQKQKQVYGNNQGGSQKQQKQAEGYDPFLDQLKDL